MGLLNFLKIISICWDCYKTFNFSTCLKIKIYVYSKTLLSLVNLLYINTNTVPLCCLGQRMKCNFDNGLLAMDQWAQRQTTPVLGPVPVAQMKWRVFISPSDLDYHEWLGTRMCVVFLFTFHSILLGIKLIFSPAIISLD